jgi:hypothetical protein
VMELPIARAGRIIVTVEVRTDACFQEAIDE